MNPYSGTSSLAQVRLGLMRYASCTVQLCCKLDVLLHDVGSTHIGRIGWSGLWKCQARLSQGRAQHTLVLVASSHSTCALIFALTIFRPRQLVLPRSNKQAVVTIDGRYRHNTVLASALECQASLHEGNFYSSGFYISNENLLFVLIPPSDAVAADDLMIEQRIVSNSSSHSHILESQSCWRSLPSDVASSSVPVLRPSSTATSETIKQTTQWLMANSFNE